jgi:cyanophycin synthetase
MILKAKDIPVPAGKVISDLSMINGTIISMGFPLITKPVKARQGEGITRDIRNKEQLIQGYEEARKYSESVLVKQYVKGNNYRFLLVNNKVVAAARRISPFIRGNGMLTISELLQKANYLKLPAGSEDTSKVDESIARNLRAYNLSLRSVLEEGREFSLGAPAGSRHAGTAIDVMDKVHPENIRVAEYVAAMIGFDICRIDVIAPYITQPLRTTGGMMTKINFCPGLRKYFTLSENDPGDVWSAELQLESGHNTVPSLAVFDGEGQVSITGAEESGGNLIMLR